MSEYNHQPLPITIRKRRTICSCLSFPKLLLKNKQPKSGIMPEFISIFIAPLTTKVPLALEVACDSPSTAIADYVRQQHDALHGFPLGKQHDHILPLIPLPDNWVLFNVFRCTILFPADVDALWSNPASRKKVAKKTHADRYIVLPLSALFGDWYPKEKGFLESLARCFPISDFAKGADLYPHDRTSIWEPHFYHYEQFHNKKFALQNNHVQLPLHITLWLPGLPVPVDVIAPKAGEVRTPPCDGVFINLPDPSRIGGRPLLTKFGSPQIGAAISRVLSSINHPFPLHDCDTSSQNFDEKAMYVSSHTPGKEWGFLCEYFNPMAWAAVDRDMSSKPQLVPQTIVDVFTTEKLYDKSRVGSTSALIVLPLRHANLAGEALAALGSSEGWKEWEIYWKGMMEGREEGEELTLLDADEFDEDCVSAKELVGGENGAVVRYA